MAALLDGLRQALLKAAVEAAADMQVATIAEAEYAMLELPWDWRGLVHDPERQGYPYGDGGLIESLELLPVKRKKNVISFGLLWDPVDEESGRHYAELVHDGSPVKVPFLVGIVNPPPMARYTGRPWTAWLMPKDQRGVLSVRFARTDWRNLPEQGWNVMKSTFATSLNSKLRAFSSSPKSKITLKVR